MASKKENRRTSVKGPAVPVRQRTVRSALIWAMVASSRLTRLRNRIGRPPGWIADICPALSSGEQTTILGRLLKMTQPRNLYETTPLAEVGFEGVPLASGELLLLDDGGRLVGGPVPFTGDALGFFSVELNLPVSGAKGIRRLAVKARYRGRFLPGTGRVTVLPRNHAGAVVVSDIDKTYLVSRIRSGADIARLLVSSGLYRKTLPKMHELMLQLRTSGPALRPLVFLTGSPHFFKQTLEAKFEKERLPVDGLYLRPPPLRFSEKMGYRDMARYLHSLGNQLAFKLNVLLQLCLQAPAASDYLLLGDDGQTDPLAYSTFAAYLDGRLANEYVLDIALSNGAGREELSLMESLLSLLGRRTTSGRVRFIGIRDAGGSGLEQLDRFHRSYIDCVHRDTGELRRALESRGFLKRRTV